MIFTLLQFTAQNSDKNSVYFDFFPVFVFVLVGILFVVLNVAVVSRLIRPKVVNPNKLLTYECGEEPVGDSWIRFDIRFYTVALVFLIFEVEVAFLFPWAAVFKSLYGTQANWAGAFVLIEMLFFLVVLLVGFVYVWAKGDLEWVRSLMAQEKK